MDYSMHGAYCPSEPPEKNKTQQNKKALLNFDFRHLQL